MSKDIAFDREIVQRELQNFQKDLSRLEIENGQKHFGHVQFGFQESLV
jgi:hypothetical protein